MRFAICTSNARWRRTAGIDARLAHELADCLWAVIVLSRRLDVDLQSAFLATMDDLEQRLPDAAP